MKDEKISVGLRCLFCRDELVAEDKKYQPGDLIKCTKCDESNDFDSVIEVGKEKYVSEKKTELEALMKKTLGKTFKFK